MATFMPGGYKSKCLDDCMGGQQSGLLKIIISVSLSRFSGEGIVDKFKLKFSAG